MSKLILIADDDITSCLLLSKMVEMCGFSCHVVHNGADAAKAAMTHRYCLVFMDLVMPVLSGYEATMKILALNSSFPPPLIIGLISYQQESMRLKCLQSGMTDVLVKPYERQSVQKFVNDALERHAPSQVAIQRPDVKLSVKNGRTELCNHTEMQFGHSLLLKVLIEIDQKTKPSWLTSRKN